MTLQIRLNIKRKIYEKYKGICQKCGKKCVPFGSPNRKGDFYGKDRATIDHLLPFAFFKMFNIKWISKNSQNNLSLLCRQCNLTKNYVLDISDEIVWKEVSWLLEAKRNELKSKNTPTWKYKLTFWLSQKKLQYFSKLNLLD